MATIPPSTNSPQDIYAQSTGNKRARPVVSCLECHRKKLKCDRTLPCNQCLKIGRPQLCNYQSEQRPHIREDEQTVKRSRITPAALTVIYDASETPGAASVAMSVAQSSNNDAIDDLQTRVALLERAVLDKASTQTAATSHSDLRATRSGLGGGVTRDEDDDAVPSYYAKHGRPFALEKFPAAFAYLQKLKRSHPNDGIYQSTAKELIILDQAVRSKDATNPSPVTQFPDKKTCRLLSDLYFDSLEHCFRVLHRPQFESMLEKFYDGSQIVSGAPDHFLPLFTGTVMLGALLRIHPECFHTLEKVTPDECVKIMQDYLNGLHHIQHFHLVTIQIRMLLLLVTWLSGYTVDSMWVMHGQIVRYAILMRMDRDPDEIGLEPYEGELQRRLWMTIVENDLMLSNLCGVPCSIPYFTCNPPANINDIELFSDMRTLPPSRPFEEWTDSMCQHVLAGSLPKRVEAYKLLHDVDPTKKSANSLKYNTILTYAKEFEQLLQALPPPLRFDHTADDAEKTPSRLMARMEVDISLRRPLLRILYPFAAAAKDDDHFKEARAIFNQSCMMLTVYQDLFDPQFSEIDVGRPDGYWDFFHNVYRLEILQSLLGLCLEIQRKVRLEQYPAISRSGSDGNILTPSRTTVKSANWTKNTLLTSITDTLDPMMRRISHPGASIKDLLCLTVVLTSITAGGQDGQHGIFLEREMTRAVHEMISTCREKLENEGRKLDAEGFGNVGSQFLSNSNLLMAPYEQWSHWWKELLPPLDPFWGF